MNEKIYVSFHIGRGGHFNNPGHLTFHGEEDFQQLISRCSDVSMIINEDENGKPLPDEDWQLVDTGSNVILQGRDEIEAMTGRLEWDTIYDTDYVTTVDDLSESETELIWKAYCDEEYMSEELKDAICTLKDKKRVNSIKQYPSNLVCGIQQGTETIDVDQQYGLYTRDEWKEDLEDRGFCPLSVEKILDHMDYYDCTTESGFFNEGEDE
jgi:hypothetical protein